MTISIPDTLTSENSGKYIMSIRLWSGGLSFSCYCPSVNDSFFYRNVEFDRTSSYLTSLKDFFFTHDFLGWVYKRVNVVCVSSQYALVPQDLYNEKEKDRYLSFAFSSSDKQVLNNLLKVEKVELVFGINDEIYEFCSRSLLNPCFIHSIVPLLTLWKKQSKLCLSRQMYVVLRQKSMDVVCFSGGNLLFVNSFEAELLEDILYYILYVWRQTGMEQEVDQLHLSGESSLRNSVMNTLRTYLRQVSPVEIPSEAYLLGAEVVQAPIDLISLSVCEL